MKKKAVLLVSAGLAVIVAAFFLFGRYGDGVNGAEWLRADASAQGEQERQLSLFFEGGKARISLLNEDAVLEFDERQPLTIQLERKADRICVQPLPDEIFQHRKTSIARPEVGDIIIDVYAKEVFICCREMEAAPGRLLLGHVTSGMEDLSCIDGTFEVFAMREDS